MFCRNLFASNISRNCSIGMNEDFNLVNNVTFIGGTVLLTGEMKPAV